MLNYLKEALGNFKDKNIPQAELLCRRHLELSSNDSSCYSLLGDIALQVGAFNHALDNYQQALDNYPGFAAAHYISEKINIAQQKKISLPDNQSSHRKKFLLIKAWGYGFWSDLYHVLGQLFVAEMTGREPIVHWGSNSLYSSSEYKNAFEIYFERVSKSTIQDILTEAQTFYPPKWDKENLFEENFNKGSGPFSRIPGLNLLYRDEDVVVSDFYTPLAHLIPWLEKSNPLYGQKTQEIFHHLFIKYIKLKPYLKENIQAFWNQNMLDQKWLAVHVRGSDKKNEEKNLEQIHNEYFSQVDFLLKVEPELSIFLLTDSEPILKNYKQRYGAKVLHTDCIRVSGEVGIHKSGYPGELIAQETILDTYLAARCDYFLGSGSTNVSTMVQNIKEWEKGAYQLIGPNRSLIRNMTLHFTGTYEKNTKIRFL